MGRGEWGQTVQNINVFKPLSLSNMGTVTVHAKYLDKKKGGGKASSLKREPIMALYGHAARKAVE